MAESNSTKKRDLPKYLYWHKARQCYKFKLPGMDREEYLEPGLSKEEACRLFSVVRERYMTRKTYVGKLLPDYIGQWREKHLPTLMKGRSRELLGKRTRHEYALVCRNILEPMEALRAPPHELDVVAIRQAIAPYLDRPRQYNYCKVCLSHVYQMLVRAGECATNPLLLMQRDGVVSLKRDVYLPDSDYAAIRAAAKNDWERHLFDLHYLVSGRSGSVLDVIDDITGGAFLPYHESKNSQDVNLEMNDDLAEVVEWFRAAKRDANIISRRLVVCLPAYTAPRWRARLRGKPVRQQFVSKAFASAVAAAGFSAGKYRLGDLRSKGITDEVLVDRASNKGAHKDLRTRDNNYVRLRLPVQVKNNLVRIK